MENEKLVPAPTPEQRTEELDSTSEITKLKAQIEEETLRGDLAREQIRTAESEEKRLLPVQLDEDRIRLSVKSTELDAREGRLIEQEKAWKIKDREQEALYNKLDNLRNALNKKEQELNEKEQRLHE